MNHRLADQYLQIESQNRERFLNNDLEIDKTWGNDIWGVTLQIDLPENVRDALCKYQKELTALEPNKLLLLPRQYQHISFNQVVFWGGEYALGPQHTWNSIADDFLSGFLELNNKYSSFEITFSQLIATSGGIIWVATDNDDEMETIRGDLQEKLPFPKETAKFNHIIHTTVARYKNKLDSPEKVQTYIQGHDEKISMPIKRIVLRKELVFPSIRTEEVAHINLI